jgi:tetratricopeptide (TPR) repeat protein
MRQLICGSIALATLFAATGAALAEKDQGPTASRCEAFAKASAAWESCVASAAAQSDAELFYAGYWLAKTGRYDEALEYLTRIAAPDERVLTYIGFATRKKGDTERAMGFYAGALARNPDFAVARAYLGEAHLARGDEAAAAGELAEIGRRCGTACAEYADLAGHIAAWRAARRG